MEQSAQRAEEAPADIVWGLRNIGRIIKRNEEQTGYLAKTGALGDAVKKVGGVWVGSRRKLLQAVNAI